MKISIFFFGLLLHTVAYTQNVLFSKIPQNLQLYARDDNNQAIVDISGKVKNTNYTGVSVKTSKNTTNHYYKKILLYNNSQSFDFQIPIQAEYNTNYTFDIFLHTSTDSVLVEKRQEVICGDVYVILGQSNALFSKPLSNGYARAFGKNDFQTYNLADTTWANTYAYQVLNSNVGSELASQILTKNRVPVCIIPGGGYGYAIASFLRREENDKDYYQNNLTGRVAYRVQKAGYKGKVKGLIWWHGESAAAGNSPLTYERDFDKLYQQWKMDFGDIKKIILMQINLIDAKVAEAGNVRDIQRRFQEKYANVETIATTGLPNYDGLHYTDIGYAQAAQEAYRIFAQQFYGSTKNTEFSSPAIKNVYFNSPTKNGVTLVFGTGHTMAWQDELTLKHSKTGNMYKSNLKDYFYSANNKLNIVSARVSNNAIHIDFPGPVNISTMTYLPDWYALDDTEFFQGPYLKNSVGMRALTFKDFSVSTLPSPTSLITIPSNNGVLLKWAKNTAEAVEYEIERSEEDTLSFIKIGTSKSPEYLDNNYKTTKVFYRVRNVLYNTVISDYSKLVGTTAIIVANEGTEAYHVKINPNPSRDYLDISLDQTWQLNQTYCQLITNDGTILDTFDIQAGVKKYRHQFSNLQTGVYYLKLMNKSEVITKKVLIMN